VLGDPLDPLNSCGIREAQRAIVRATVATPDIASGRVAQTLRRVIVLSLERGAPGEQRWLAEAWRRIDPLGYAEHGQFLCRAPYPGVEATPIEEARQSIVERLFDSTVPDDRLLALRVLEMIGA
jgi:hypothetical protein